MACTTSSGVLHVQISEAMDVLREAAVKEAAKAAVKEASTQMATPFAPQTPSMTAMLSPGAPASPAQHYSSNGSADSPSPPSWSATSGPPHDGSPPVGTPAGLAPARLPPVPYGVPVTLNGPVKAPHAPAAVAGAAPRPDESRDVSDGMARMDISK